ncbi:DUF3265 domain-containing protein [Vibrio rotiferianus]|nr:DUF3265 domain-containing protein [Vibrio rotiferianus]TMX57734.1 DUF3265 domain-containing protein [Vibrio rotiferianus]TMX62801.1 DUF3265 domain-containing protein [Vibrio rotiferianus]
MNRNVWHFYYALDFVFMAQWRCTLVAFLRLNS